MFTYEAFWEICLGWWKLPVSIEDQTTHTRKQKASWKLQGQAAKNDNRDKKAWRGRLIQMAGGQSAASERLAICKKDGHITQISSQYPLPQCKHRGECTNYRPLLKCAISTHYRVFSRFAPSSDQTDGETISLFRIKLIGVC